MIDYKNLVKRTLQGLAIGGGIYVFGLIAYDSFSKGPRMEKLDFFSEYSSNKKEEITMKINYYNQILPLLPLENEGLIPQYKDSLELAVRDTTLLGEEIRDLKKKSDERAKKALYSWLAFFME